MDSNNDMLFLREIVKLYASVPYLIIYQSNIYFFFFWNYLLSVWNSHTALPGLVVHTGVKHLDLNKSTQIVQVCV